jgi:hypothetical protein
MGAGRGMESKRWGPYDKWDLPHFLPCVTLSNTMERRRRIVQRERFFYCVYYLK